MNFKTTWILSLLFLMLLAVGYWQFGRAPALEGREVAEPPKAPTSATLRDLLEKKPGDVVKVVCRLKDREDWVFEKFPPESGVGTPVWKMTAPNSMPVIGYEIDKIVRQLTGLQYEVSYKPGEPGAVTAAAAGLDPAHAVVTFTDKEGATASVEIGRPASEDATYVRTAGDDRICLGKTNLKYLIKTEPLEYRDPQVWNFTPENVTAVDIIDRSDDPPTNYAFKKDGSKWMMTSPVTAKATTKIDDMIRTLSRLRIVKWEDDKADRLSAYGLQPATLTVSLTTEEKTPLPKSKEAKAEVDSGDESTDPESEENSPAENEEPEFEIKKSSFVLHVSDRSPIGEDTKAYVRFADESVVATLLKTQTDKFKPVISEWRDMHVTSSPISAATRIELLTPRTQATLVKSEGKWAWDQSGDRVEESQVSALLKAAQDLTAVSFVDATSQDLAAFGLDKPQAEIRVVAPGIEGVERLSVGGYSDPATKRLVFVRRNDSPAIAKVRAADVAPLTQSPRAYMDRTICDVPAPRIEKITLDVDSPFAGTRINMNFERAGDKWTFIAPTAAPVRNTEFSKLVETVAGLKAQSVVADADAASAYGLDVPMIRLSATYKPPVEYRIETPADAPDVKENEGDSTEPDESAEPKKAVPVEVQPPPKTMELAVTKHDGKIYARRADGKHIYEIASDVFTQLTAEYRPNEVLNFEDAKVKKFSIRSGKDIHGFERRDGRWIYSAEPDLPLDQTKVKNLLLQGKDLRTERYVRYDAADLHAFGLDEPARQFTVTLEDDAELSVRVSDKVCEPSGNKSVFASVTGFAGVFLLTPDMVRRLEVSLSDLETPR